MKIDFNKVIIKNDCFFAHIIVIGIFGHKLVEHWIRVTMYKLATSHFIQFFKFYPYNLKNFFLLKLNFFFFLNIFFIIFLLLLIAFFTLTERKIIASVQRREGPNVTGFFGLLQPLADGLKLVLKEFSIPKYSKKYLFILAPIFTFFIALLLWLVVPLNINLYLYDIDYSILFIMALSSLGAYTIILAGWSSNSKYALLGALRAAAQVISYELILSFIILILISFSGSLNLIEIINFQYNNSLLYLLIPLFFLFLLVLLAETNRLPFDLAESEAELVAGYNTEYSGILFALFFLAEYSNIIIVSLLTIFLFTPIISYSVLGIIFLSVKLLGIIFFFVIIRAAIPRVRYDQLMEICWKILLPFTFSLFMIITSFLYTFNISSLKLIIS